VRSKRKFERKLAENIKQDLKSFFAYVRKKAKGKAAVGSVENKNGGLVNSIEQICEEFNEFLLRCFQTKGLRISRMLRPCLMAGKRICCVKVT